MDIDKFKSKADEQEQVCLLKEELLHLRKQYENLWKSNSYIEKRIEKVIEFKNSITEEFKTYLKRNNFEISTEGSKTVGIYKQRSLELDMHEDDSFQVKSSEQKHGCFIMIRESERNSPDPLHLCTIRDNKLDFPGGAKYPNDISFLKDQRNKLLQDIENLSDKINNVDIIEFEFVCVFHDSYNIHGEYSTIESIIKIILNLKGV